MRVNVTNIYQTSLLLQRLSTLKQTGKLWQYYMDTHSAATVKIETLIVGNAAVIIRVKHRSLPPKAGKSSEQTQNTLIHHPNI